MDTKAEYSLTDTVGNMMEKGVAEAILIEDKLELKTRSEQYITLSLKETLTINSVDPQIDIHIRDGRRLKLSSLGNDYGNFLGELHRLRNELILTNSFQDEKLRIPIIEAELRPFREIDGSCKIYLYDLVIVFIPHNYALFQVRYSNIEGIESRDSVLRIFLKSGESLYLTMLGNSLDPLWSAISNAMAELAMEAQNVIRSVYPQIDRQSLDSAAALLWEGRAASRWDIEDSSEELLKHLYERIENGSLASSYSYMISHGRRDMLRIGIKRSAIGDTCVWYTIPILGSKGNAVAAGIMSHDNSAGATYFFRISPHSIYFSMDDENREMMAEHCMDLITTGLQETNFHWLPIYLTEEQLCEGSYFRYYFSVMYIPELRIIRDQYIGRASSDSKEEWRKEVEKLLESDITIDSNSKNDEIK